MHDRHVVKRHIVLCTVWRERRWGGGGGADAFSPSTLNSHSLEQRGGAGVGGGGGERLSLYTCGSLSRGGGGELRHCVIYPGH